MNKLCKFKRMKFFQVRFRNFKMYFFVLSIAIAHSLDNAFKCPNKLIILMCFVNTLVKENVLI